MRIVFLLEQKRYCPGWGLKRGKWELVQEEGLHPHPGQGKEETCPVLSTLNGVPVPGFSHPGLGNGPGRIPALPLASCVTLGQLLGVSGL